jgi:hypothetical protein
MLITAVIDSNFRINVGQFHGIAGQIKRAIISSVFRVYKKVSENKALLTQQIIRI